MDQQRTQWFSLYHSLQHYKYHTYLMCKDEVGLFHTCVLGYTLIHLIRLCHFSVFFFVFVCLFVFSFVGPCADCISPGAGGRTGARGDGPEVPGERSLGRGAL